MSAGGHHHDLVAQDPHQFEWPGYAQRAMSARGRGRDNRPYCTNNARGRSTICHESQLVIIATGYGRAGLCLIALRGVRAGRDCWFQLRRRRLAARRFDCKRSAQGKIRGSGRYSPDGGRNLVGGATTARQELAGGFSNGSAKARSAILH